MSTVAEMRADNIEAFLALRGKLADALRVALAAGADAEEAAEAVMALGETEWRYELYPAPMTHQFDLIISIRGTDSDAAGIETGDHRP